MIKYPTIIYGKYFKITPKKLKFKKKLTIINNSFYDKIT